MDVYTEKVDCTNVKSVKEDLLKFLSDYEVYVYTRADKGYEYLGMYSFMLVIKNPYSNETLDIELGGSFTVFFSNWHAHYFAFDNDYEQMKRDIKGLLSGSIGALLVMDSSNKLIVTDLCSADFTKMTDKLQFLRSHIYNEDKFEKIIKTGGSMHIVFWNPAKLLRFDIIADGEVNDEYSNQLME